MTPDGPASLDFARDALSHSRRASVEQLGDAIAELAARLQAATYELLVLIREFDERAGWNTGFTSCAHWLSWRIGLDPGAAREKVRVARALATLPMISAAMKRGALSYSKVRAISRVATPTTEQRLLDVARAGTAAHVERIVRAWRRVDRGAEHRDMARRHAQRSLDVWVDDDGMVVIRGRLTPELGALVQRALEAASDRLFREPAASPPSDPSQPEITPRQRRADALALVAESALAHDLDPGSADDRYQVVVHVDAHALTDAAASPGEPGHAALEDGPYVSAETARRLACDASIVTLQQRPDGSVLDVGRKRRTIPPAIRRALTARDRHCAFPGCWARHCEVHHIRHWCDGGPTALTNVTRLCRRHHRAVHEKGVRVTRAPDGTLQFAHPDGRPSPMAPPTPSWWMMDEPNAGDPLGPVTAHLEAAGIEIGPHAATPHWAGGRLDLVWAMDVLWQPPPTSANR